ncbi:MAG: pseudouridine synthase [Chloroflexota bacterium]
MAAERLQKLLAAAGVASRRQSEIFIATGRVRVDGRTVTTLGTRADPARQRIEVDGRPLHFAAPAQYLLLYKPAGYLTTASDPQGRATVFDLIPPGPRLFSVGRLDRDSEGLLLLTDDGNLAYRMMHPRFGLEKEYHVWTDWPRYDQLRQLATGVPLDDGMTAPAHVSELSRGPDGAVVALVLHEGRNRQVRRMLTAVELPVYRLVRVRLGSLVLGRLASGEWRTLDSEEVAWLRRRLAAANGTDDGEQRAGRSDDCD